MTEHPTSDWTRINDPADRFERAWKTGPRPRIEDYLAHDPGQARDGPRDGFAHVTAVDRLDFPPRLVRPE